MLDVVDVVVVGHGLELDTGDRAVVRSASVDSETASVDEIDPEGARGVLVEQDEA